MLNRKISHGERTIFPQQESVLAHSRDLIWDVYVCGDGVGWGWRCVCRAKDCIVNIEIGGYEV